MGTMRSAQVLEAEVLLPAPKRFVRERLALSSGTVTDWYFVDTPRSVIVVPVLPGGEFVLVKQYRYNLRVDTLEFPGGVVPLDDDPRDSAVRELREETGCELLPEGRLVFLGASFVLPSETNRTVHIFLAQGVSPPGRPGLDGELEQYFELVPTVCSRKFLLEQGPLDGLGLESYAALCLAERYLTSPATEWKKVDR